MLGSWGWVLVGEVEGGEERRPGLCGRETW